MYQLWTLGFLVGGWSRWLCWRASLEPPELLRRWQCRGWRRRETAPPRNFGGCCGNRRQEGLGRRRSHCKVGKPLALEGTPDVGLEGTPWWEEGRSEVGYVRRRAAEEVESRWIWIWIVDCPMKRPFFFPALSLSLSLSLCGLGRERKNNNGRGKMVEKAWIMREFVNAFLRKDGGRFGHRLLQPQPLFGNTISQ